MSGPKKTSAGAVPETEYYAAIASDLFTKWEALERPSAVNQLKGESASEKRLVYIRRIEKTLAKLKNEVHVIPSSKAQEQTEWLFKHYLFTVRLEHAIELGASYDVKALTSVSLPLMAEWIQTVKTLLLEEFHLGESPQLEDAIVAKAAKLSGLRLLLSQISPDSISEAERFFVDCSWRYVNSIPCVAVFIEEQKRAAQEKRQAEENQKRAAVTTGGGGVAGRGKAAIPAPSRHDPSLQGMSRKYLEAAEEEEAQVSLRNKHAEHFLAGLSEEDRQEMAIMEAKARNLLKEHQRRYEQQQQHRTDKDKEGSSTSLDGEWKHFDPEGQSYEMIHAKLVEFYERFNPAKLPLVPEILEDYNGRESELFHKLESKYCSQVVVVGPSAEGSKAPQAPTDSSHHSAPALLQEVNAPPTTVTEPIVVNHSPPTAAVGKGNTGRSAVKVTTTATASSSSAANEEGENERSALIKEVPQTPVSSAQYAKEKDTVGSTTGASSSTAAEASAVEPGNQKGGGCAIS